jgi:choline monooxygenase
MGRTVAENGDPSRSGWLPTQFGDTLNEEGHLMDVKARALAEELKRGRTLPAEWYTDPTLFTREQERIFAANWNYTGRVEQVAKPGDFLTTRVGDVPVVIVRDEARALRAYANVCRHRGSEVVLEKRGNRRTLQCHYHAWTYGLDGALRAAPHCQEQAGFNKADYSLTPLALETFGRFIFVNTGSPSCSLAETLGQLPQVVGSTGADVDSLVFRERREYAIQANWKVVVENFLECYHCAVSHPGFADLIDLNKYQVIPYERCSIQRGPLKSASRAASSRGFGTDGGQEGIYTYLWPNFMLNVYPGAGNASTNLIVPIDEHHCLAVYEFFFAETMPEDEQRAMVEFIDQVQREDIVIVESVQRGLRSGFYQQGQLILSRENGIQHFQRLVFTALAR